MEKYMPRVLGWPRSVPLPERFTAHPDSSNFKKDKAIIVSPLEPLLLDGRPTVVDLFSGCGGFSLGFIQAGWRVVAAVDWEYWAHVTYCVNIPTAQQTPLHCYTMDIRKLTGREILINAGITKVDAVIGSPPCQSFSMAGQRKVGDERDTLLWEFGRLVKELQPAQFVMENVPGMLSKKFSDGRKVMDVFMEYLQLKDESSLQGLMTKTVLNDEVLS